MLVDLIDQSLDGMHGDRGRLLQSGAQLALQKAVGLLGSATLYWLCKFTLCMQSGMQCHVRMQQSFLINVTYLFA